MCVRLRYPFPFVVYTGVSDDGSVPPGQRAGSKPMQNDDFRRVEQELANQLHHGKGAGVPPRLQAWQGAEDAMLLQSLGAFYENLFIYCFMYLTLIYFILIL